MRALNDYNNQLIILIVSFKVYVTIKIRMMMVMMMMMITHSRMGYRVPILAYLIVMMRKKNSKSYDLP